MGLYQKVRPTKLVEVVGQPAAVAQLGKMIAETNLPHTILFSGPSGTGKTTLARIICTELGCTGMDVTETNAASDNGIDMVRDIQAKMPLRTFSGKPRVYIIDEAHQLSTASQRAFLKTLEDTPSHVYFILCTTNPEKLEKPLINRCTHIRLNAVATPVIMALLKSVVPEILGKDALSIAEAADGSPRRALVMLEQYQASGPEHLGDILDVGAVDKPEWIEFVRDLYRGDNTKTLLLRHAALLKSLTDSDVEGLRCMIMSYGTTMLLGGKGTESVIGTMLAFNQPFFQSKKPGFILAVANS